MKVLLLGGRGVMGVCLMDYHADNTQNVFVTSRASHVSNWKDSRFVQSNARDNEFVKVISCQTKSDVVVDWNK